MRNIHWLTALLLGSITFGAQAADYVIDTKGAHAAVQFKISHLGFSWLYGRFDDFAGTFSYDEKNPDAAKVEVTINTASVNSNHAERDRHLRNEDFLEVEKYPVATFTSTAFKELGDGKARLDGDLNLHGVTRSITIDVEHVGHGKDPWGGYRRGFIGTTRFALKDFNITTDLGPASTHIDMTLAVEGIRK